MSPLRWDVLLLGFVLAIPLFGLGLRGDLTAEEVAMRLPWCLAAAWGVVAVLRFAVMPRTPEKPQTKKATRPAGLAETSASDSEHSPAV